MTDLDWDLIMKVHLKGTYSVTKAAWSILRDKGYGRIINTSSSSGIFGSFGQANYAAAKLAIHGFTLSLSKEGEAKNIKVNTIAPIAGTRMTETVNPKEFLDALKPEFVAPLVAVLSHEECPDNGSLFEVGAGFICKDRWHRSEGILLSNEEINPETVISRWSEVVDFTRPGVYPTSNQDMFEVLVKNILENQAKAKAQPKPTAPVQPAATPAPV
jgi:short chain dehydrogenase